MGNAPHRPEGVRPLNLETADSDEVAQAIRDDVARVRFGAVGQRRAVIIRSDRMLNERLAVVFTA